MICYYFLDGGIMVIVCAEIIELNSVLTVVGWILVEIESNFIQAYGICCKIPDLAGKRNINCMTYPG